MTSVQFDLIKIKIIHNLGSKKNVTPRTVDIITTHRQRADNRLASQYQ